jgi:hypothetical protein
VISEGHDAMLKYFSVVKGTGNKSTVQERHSIPINDNAVLIVRVDFGR